MRAHWQADQHELRDLGPTPPPDLGRIAYGQPFQIVLTLALALTLGVTLGVGLTLHTWPTASGAVWEAVLLIIWLFGFLASATADAAVCGGATSSHGPSPGSRSNASS